MDKLIKRNCSGCGNPIPEGRLKALPNTQTCTACSGTGKVLGFPMITGKTEYSDLQIVTAEQFERLNGQQNRVGYGVSEGVKFDSDKEGTSNG